MKKYYEINPREYSESDGAFYNAVDMFEDTAKPRVPKIPRSQLLAKIEYLQSFKDRTERYEPYYKLDLSRIEWVKVDGEKGAKSAYLKLKADVEGGKHKSIDTENLSGSRAYFIFSSKHYGIMEPLIADLLKCRLERLSSRTVGCMILNDNEYVFFWPKQLHPTSN